MFNAECLCMCEGRRIEVGGYRTAVVSLVLSSFLLFISYSLYAGRFGICQNTQGIVKFLKICHFFNIFRSKLLFIKVTLLSLRWLRICETLKKVRNKVLASLSNTSRWPFLSSEILWRLQTWLQGQKLNDISTVAVRNQLRQYFESEAWKLNL